MLKGTGKFWAKIWVLSTCSQHLVDEASTGVRGWERLSKIKPLLFPLLSHFPTRVA